MMRQPHFNSTDATAGNESPVMSGVPGLPAWFAPAVVLSTARPLLAGESVGGGRFGRIGRILLVCRQLPFQIRNLLLGLTELLLGFIELLVGFGQLFIALDQLPA